MERFFLGGSVTYTRSGMLSGIPNRVILGFDAEDQNN